MLIKFAHTFRSRLTNKRSICQFCFMLTFAALFSLAALQQPVLAQNSSPDPQPGVEGQPLITLYSATFSGTKYTVQKDGNPATYASNGAGGVRSPEILQNQYASPLCYKLGTTPTCTAVFNLNISGSVTAQFKLNAVLASTGLQFSYVSQQYTLSGSSVSVAFPTELNGTVLPARIDNTNFKETWLVSYDGGNSYTQIANTSNTMFAVAGTPSGGSLTSMRINRVTSDCRTLSAPADVVNAIWMNTIGPLTYNYRNMQKPIWANLDPSGTGLCYDIITLMDNAIKMTGLTSPGTFVYCYPSVNMTSFAVSALNAEDFRSCKIGDNGHTAKTSGSHALFGPNELLFSVDKTGQGTNILEACYLFNRTLYPGGEGSTTTYPYTTEGIQRVVKTITSQTEWHYLFDNSDITNPIYTNCITPGPYPEAVWGP